MGIKSDAKAIIDAAIAAVQPQAAVKAALDKLELKGRIYLVAIGKAACTMAKAACEELSIEEGIVITKYGHAQGGLGRVRVYEAGHPIPDENSVAATEQAIELAKKAGAGDTVLFLVSGGGSALFEKPLVPLDELKDISAQLIACSADIVEINTVRKRLSSVKGGRNQELALAAAEKLSGIDGACVFAVGSDGTDGPTDAAGGYVDGHTKEKLEQKGISIQESLKNNDSYNALKAIGGLIITGPTGTNVNDLYAVLIKR